MKKCVYDKDDNSTKSIEERIERLEQLVKYIAWANNTPLPSKEEIDFLAIKFHERFDKK